MEKSDCGWERNQDHEIEIGGGNKKGIGKGPFKDEVEVDYRALDCRRHQHVSRCRIGALWR